MNEPNKKLIVDDLTFDEVGLLYTSMKVMISKMNELEAPEEMIELAIPVFKKLEIVFDKKHDERNQFIELINNELDDLVIASEIITKNPDVEIPEYK
jgi:hypothetical protein